MTRTAALVVAAAALLGLAGCGDSSLVPTAGEAGAPPSPSPSAATTTSSAPTLPDRPVEPTTAAPTAPAPSTTASTAQPSVSHVAPVQTPGSGSPSRALASVRTDVERVAPALEVFYQEREYPLDLAQVRSTLPEAGVSLAAGNTIAGYDYGYDGNAVEFVLCIESTSGAFATYDTAPMAPGRSGESGGCPG